MSKILRAVMQLAVVALMTSCAIGCNKTEDDDVAGNELAFVKEEKVRYAERYQNESISEAGIIYDDMEAGLVHLVTIDEGEDMVFCYDPNCRHIPATKDYPDSECMGALVYGNTRTAYYEGCIYFFVGDSMATHKIYKMKTDGAGRMLVAELPFSYDIKKGCIFKEDKVYYIAKILNIDDITNKASVTTRIVEVNLLDASYRFISKETTDTQMQMDMACDTLYLRRYNAKGQQYTVRVNVNTLEEDFAVTSEQWGNEFACMGAYDDDSFYYYGKQNFDIGIRNVDGTVEKILVQGAEGETFGWPDVSCDGLMYQRELDYGDEKAGYYFLDFTTGKVTNITDEKEKYGLFGYDGYYDVFVAHDGTFNNWTMWSKEKVLGEAKE